MNQMSNEENLRNELQQISGTLQQFEEYSKHLQTQLETLRSYMLDLSRSKTTLVNLKEEDNPEETLMQLGSGIMMKAKPLDTKNVLVSVGAGIVVTKPVDAAIINLDKRIEEVEIQSQTLVDQLDQIANQMGNLERQGQGIIQQLQGPAPAQYDPSLVS